MKNNFIFFTIAIVAFILFGCEEKNTENATISIVYENDDHWDIENSLEVTTLTVTFNTNKGNLISPITGLDPGNIIERPVVPTRSGFERVFVGWYDQAFETAFDFCSPILNNITLYAKWRPHELGETGPGGGTIFYRRESGFIMTDDNSIAHYLEAALNNMPTVLAWASSKFIPEQYFLGEEGDWLNVQGTSRAIGTGRRNTALILALDAEAPAARAANEYYSNGKTNWFLPSYYELRALLQKRDYFENLAINDHQPYHSSTQTAPSSVAVLCYSIAIDPDRSSHSLKNAIMSVRAIRAF